MNEESGLLFTVITLPVRRNKYLFPSGFGADDPGIAVSGIEVDSSSPRSIPMIVRRVSRGSAILWRAEVGNSSYTMRG